MEQFNKNLIGERIRETRKRNHVTQLKLCKRLGIPQSNLSLYESDKVTPSLNVLVAISKEFGVTVDYLLGISENAKSADVVLREITSAIKTMADNKASENEDYKKCVIDCLEIINGQKA